MKRAIFPDGKLLQPIPLPEGGHANISGNINSSTTDTFTNPQNTDNNTNANNSSNNTETQNPNLNDIQNIPLEKTGSHYYIWFSIIFIMIVLFIWKFKKIKNYLNESA